MEEQKNSEISKTRRVIGSSIFISGMILLLLWLMGLFTLGGVLQEIFQNSVGNNTDTWAFIGGILLMMIGGGIGFDTESPESEK